LLQEAVAILSHRRVRDLGCLLETPTIRVAREWKVDEAIRCRQLQPITMRRTSETDAFLSVEDADSPWTF
jgi:hypothetical protein